MSTFTGLSIERYRKAYLPQRQDSHKEFIDRELHKIETTVEHLTRAVEQLQAEMALIWTELVALGRTRP